MSIHCADADLVGGQAGILLSYWENEEPVGPFEMRIPEEKFEELINIHVVKSEHLYVPETTDDLKLSPVYSLAVQNQSLWLLSGLEVVPSHSHTYLHHAYISNTLEWWHKPPISTSRRRQNHHHPPQTHLGRQRAHPRLRREIPLIWLMGQERVRLGSQYRANNKRFSK